MEATIRKYFQAWTEADLEPLKEIFSENVSYSECCGPEYHGLAQIIRWFEDWNTRGRVLEWTIKRVIKQKKRWLPSGIAGMSMMGKPMRLME